MNKYITYIIQNLLNNSKKCAFLISEENNLKELKLLVIMYNFLYYVNDLFVLIKNFNIILVVDK